jgi:hypothetical protein
MFLKIVVHSKDD